MSRRKGVLVPKNSFLDTIATRFAGDQSCFILGTAQVKDVNPIIYCSDGFCTLTEHPRSQVMHRSCSCDFLFGPKTSIIQQRKIWQALSHGTELKCEISLYKKSGSLFRCLLDIVTVNNQQKSGVPRVFLVCLKEDTCSKITITDDSDDQETPSTMPDGLPKNYSTPSDSPVEVTTPGGFAQRRRSRAVLYNLLDGDIDTQRRNGLSPVSTIFSGNDRKVLEHQISHSFKKSRTVVLHYGTLRTLWDWLIMLFILYIAATVPYYIAVQSIGTEYFKRRNSIYPYRFPTVWFDVFLEFIFMFDIGLKFRTTYVNSRGQLVSNPKEIALHYLKTTFIIDLVTAVPVDIICQLFPVIWPPASLSSQIFKGLRLCRMYKLIKVCKWSRFRWLVLLILMVTFGMLAHWLACIWFSIGWMEYNALPQGAVAGPGWIFELAHDMNTPFFTNKTGGPEITAAYITSLYFTLSSLTSVGFGNVSANTNLEKIISNIVMLIGACMHAVVFGNITSIIQRMGEKQCEFDKRERNLNHFLMKHGFAKPLSRRLTDYFQANWAMNKGVNEKEVIKEFPEDLQTDIAMHLHCDLLNLPVFKDACQGCKRYAAMHASRRQVAVSEIFIHEGDPLEHVFLVCSGSLEVSQNTIISAILGKGDLFGGDVTNDAVVTSKSQVKAYTFCELQCISLDGLRKIATMYPAQCDITDDFRNDYSFQLWEEVNFDKAGNCSLRFDCDDFTTSLRRQRNTKIENWNKHYSVDEPSDDDDSYVCYPAVTVRTDTEPAKHVNDIHSPSDSIEEDLKGTEHSSEDGYETELKQHTLQIPGLSAADDCVSPLLTTRSPSPCLRSHIRTHSIKKRVSFNDRTSSESFERKTSEADGATTVFNEVFALDNTDLSNPISSSPDARSPQNSHFEYEQEHKDNTFGSNLKRRGQGNGDRNSLSPINKREHDTAGLGRRSFSPGSYGELRRRRRRKKHAQKLARTSSSSLEEDSTKLDHPKERKISVVEFCRDPTKSRTYQRHSSPESRSSESGSRVTALERKIDRLQTVVFAIAKNVEKILQLHETERTSTVEGYGGPTVDYEPKPAFPEQRFVEYAVTGSESNDHLNCSRHSEVPTSEYLHSTSHSVVLQRPNSAPSFCYAFASLTNECEIPKANFHRRSASTAFKSIKPSVYGCTQFNEAERNDFSDCGDGCPAASDCRMQIACLKTPTARKNVPEISISNYDDYSECGTMERPSPKRRDGTGFLQIPVKRRIGGSESGYSTSSPSPDVACV